MVVIFFVHLKNRTNDLDYNRKVVFFFKPFFPFESAGGNSNLTKENLRGSWWRILFIDEKNFFSFVEISSDGTSHVVDFRNWCLNIINNKYLQVHWTWINWDKLNLNDYMSRWLNEVLIIEIIYI